MEIDERYMQRCLQLAQLAEGNVAPNPLVGAVLVHNAEIIGEGYHEKFGEGHAEVNCIQSVAPEHQHLIEHATMYVSLEPCSHFGKTPPCADRIIRHEIPRVVIGCTDPYKQVAGHGIEKLRAAGIDVTIGVLEKECRALNKRFVTFQEQQRPYITLKWAQTTDGKIAGENFQRIAISNAYTNRLIHRLRSQNMSILVGTNTALYDNPELTTRLWPGSNPVRLVVDKNLRLPHSLRLFDGRQKTIVFNTQKQQELSNLLYYQLKEEHTLPQQIKQALYELKLQSVLVEGGAQLLQSFIGAGLWDEAIVISNETQIAENGIAAPSLQQHRLVQVQRIISDTIHTYAHQSNRLI